MPVYQDKKTKKWYYRAYADDVYGNHKQFEKHGFKTKKEATTAESELCTSDEKECTISFMELWEDYDKYIKLKLKKQSYRKTVSKFNNHIIPYFKKYKVKSINVSIYTKWQQEIEKKHFSHDYNSSLHSSMVTILNYAKKFHGLKVNIASNVGNFVKKTELPKKVDFWTYEEFKKFIQIVKEKHYQIFFETLYFTGLRQGECLALTWKDFKDNYLDIYKTISKEQENGQYIINTPKTKNSIRKIKVDSHLVGLLNELKESYKKYEGFNDDWYIFGGIKPFAPTTIGRKKDKYCALAGVKKIRIHDLRHSHASLLLSFGVPITVISQRLGHSDINMTLNTYSHLMPRDEDKAINMINDLIKCNPLII